MAETVEICMVCAWRATCQKEFSLSGKNIRCPDLVKDITLNEQTQREKKEEEVRR